MNQYAGFEHAAYIQSAAALNPEQNRLTVFVINADWEDAQELALDVRGFAGWKLKSHSCLYDEDPEACNTWENPNRLVPREMPVPAAEKGIYSAVLPRLSWNVFRFEKE